LSAGHILSLQSENAPYHGDDGLLEMDAMIFAPLTALELSSICIYVQSTLHYLQDEVNSVLWPGSSRFAT